MIALLGRYGAGLVLAGAIAALAKLLDAGGFGAALLFALLLGMLARPLALQPHAAGGVDFSAKHLLAIAVALLGVRLTVGDIVAIGFTPAVVVIAALALTFAGGLFAARILGLSANVGVIAAAGTVFCGATAAAAIASILPKTDNLERDTALVIAGVIGLSAIAMIVYPLVAIFLGFDELHAGVFLGGSIHNVPQAVAAGMTISESAGDTATLTKLFRVSLLAPFLLGLAVAVRRPQRAHLASIELPWFVVAFAIFVAIASFGIVPSAVKSILTSISAWLMLIAVAAIGMKTSLEAMATVGTRVLLLLIVNSFVLAILLASAIRWGAL